MLGMGLGFEMPVVILTLVKIGVLNYRILSKGRRYMIVINLILGAVLTTPEVITQIIMFLPLQLLYELSVWVAWYWERQEKKKEAAEAENPGA
jgi:sec-independent protein translocase protein TatC